MLKMLRFGSVGSTMDVAKEMIDTFPTGRFPSAGSAEWNTVSTPTSITEIKCLSMSEEGGGGGGAAAQRSNEPFVILADEQTKSRATKDRKWASSTGNMYMSLVVPTVMIPSVLVPILPLYVGLRAREGMVNLVRKTSCSHSLATRVLLDDKVSSLKLKWPNDILGDGGRKIMGVLIENHSGYFIIGIGANVMTAPSQETILSLDAREGRVPGCLVDHFTSELWKSGSAEDLSCEITKSFLLCLSVSGEGPDARQDIVRSFKAHMEFNVVMQKRAERVDDGKAAPGAKVVPIGLNDWGLLEVKHVDSGRKETLSADYLI